MSSKQRYSEYLKTDYWAEVTKSVKSRAGWKCQVCNSPHDLQAHHRTYEHLGKKGRWLQAGFGGLKAKRYQENNMKRL